MRPKHNPPNLQRQIDFAGLYYIDRYSRTDGKSVSHTVHSLMDRTGVISAPKIVLPAVRYANNHVPPNLGIRVVIKADMFTHVIVDIGQRVAPRLIHNIYFVDTLEEGRAFIARRSKKAYS